MAHKGPRRDVHIRIAYSGKAPGPLLLGKRDELEKRLSAENAGTAVRNAANNVAVNICVITADAERTSKIAWKHINDLGLSGRTTVHVESAEQRAREAR